VQARVPFDEATTKFIASLDPDKDLALLKDRDIFVRPECARIFKAANMVLKKVAARGLPPSAATDILERHSLRKSTMEKMHKCAIALCHVAETNIIRRLIHLGINCSDGACLTCGACLERAAFKCARGSCGLLQQRLHVGFRLVCDRALREEASAEHSQLAVVPSHSSSQSSTPRTSTSASVLISDAIYLRHLSMLLDEYLQDIDPADELVRGAVPSPHLWQADMAVLA
jgi:hypothetical protein